MIQDPRFDVLVIDDDQTTFDLIEHLANELFTEANFICLLSAQQVTDYLENPKNKLPQLVLLDIDLHQDVDGLSLLPHLHSRFRGQVPIVMFTMSDLPSSVKQAYSLGAVAYTTKPHDLAGWKEYITILRKYWYEITLLPPTAPPPLQLLTRR